MPVASLVSSGCIPCLWCTAFRFLLTLVLIKGFRSFLLYVCVPVFYFGFLKLVFLLFYWESAVGALGVPGATN